MIITNKSKNVFATECGTIGAEETVDIEKTEAEKLLELYPAYFVAVETKKLDKKQDKKEDKKQGK